MSKGDDDVPDIWSMCALGFLTAGWIGGLAKSIRKSRAGKGK